mgnify:CR=1 FL=1
MRTFIIRLGLTLVISVGLIGPSHALLLPSDYNIDFLGTRTITTFTFPGSAPTPPTTNPYNGSGMFTLNNDGSIDDFMATIGASNFQESSVNDLVRVGDFIHGQIRVCNDGTDLNCIITNPTLSLGNGTFSGGWSYIFTSYSAQGTYSVKPKPTASEPATLAIFGLGLAGLGLMRRRKKAA